LDPKDSTTERTGINPEYAPEWLVQQGLPEKVSQLRRKLYLKAKQEPEFRFYALYDRIYRKDVLMVAWTQVRAKGGAGGPDGVTIDQIVAQEGGPERLVDQLHEELRTKTYCPGYVRRVYIPKPDGRERPLGIPNVRDRVVQKAAMLVLEPIFEADFLDSSYGFRPKRSAHDALNVIRSEIKNGRKAVYDADLQGYFDSIPHDKLMAAVQQRIVDRSVLALIRMWLNAPVIDKRDGGPPRRNHQGTPQGGVISPLLANIYLHWFDKAFHGKSGPARFANARLVRYADDFVILARYQGKQLVEWVERTLEGRLGLKINRQKTRIVNLSDPGNSLDFLGYTFRYDLGLKDRSYRYLNMAPSKKALGREREKLRELTSARMCFKPVRTLIEEINCHLEGWSNYFSWGYPRKAMREINRMVRIRLSAHLGRRSQRRYRPPAGKSLYRHLADLGLVYL
jgi:RNA-directed DNA polymerase